MLSVDESSCLAELRRRLEVAWVPKNRSAKLQRNFYFRVMGEVLWISDGFIVRFYINFVDGLSEAFRRCKASRGRKDL